MKEVLITDVLTISDPVKCPRCGWVHSISSWNFDSFSFELSINEKDEKEWERKYNQYCLQNNFGDSKFLWKCGNRACDQWVPGNELELLPIRVITNVAEAWKKEFEVEAFCKPCGKVHPLGISAGAGDAGIGYGLHCRYHDDELVKWIKETAEDRKIKHAIGHKEAQERLLKCADMVGTKAKLRTPSLNPKLKGVEEVHLYAVRYIENYGGFHFSIEPVNYYSEPEQLGNWIQEDDLDYRTYFYKGMEYYMD